jgi:predicted DNA-binding protein with PD1-like motif
MNAKLVAEGSEKTYVLVFDSGDAVVEGLQSFARELGLTGARFTGIGALSDVVLGYFDWQRKEYERIPLDEQVEVLTLTGDVADDGGAPAVHAHVVVGKRDGTAHGGHLIEAHVRPTLEVVLVESPAHLRKSMDRESGLALIDLDASGAG